MGKKDEERLPIDRHAPHGGGSRPTGTIGSPSDRAAEFADDYEVFERLRQRQALAARVNEKLTRLERTLDS